MECKLYVVESLEPDAYDNNFIINNRTKRFCGVNQLWAYAETVVMAREKQKLRRACQLSCFVSNHFLMILNFRPFLLHESQIS